MFFLASSNPHFSAPNQIWNIQIVHPFCKGWGCLNPIYLCPLITHELLDQSPPSLVQTTASTQVRFLTKVWSHQPNLLPQGHPSSKTFYFKKMPRCLFVFINKMRCIIFTPQVQGCWAMKWHPKFKVDSPIMLKFQFWAFENQRTNTSKEG